MLAESTKAAFNDFYRQYLGITAKCAGTVIACKRRSEPFCFYYRHLIIATQIEDNYFCSVAPEYAEVLSGELNFNTTETVDEKLMAIDDALCKLLEHYSIAKFYSNTNDKNTFRPYEVSDEIVVLSDKYRDMFFSPWPLRGNGYKEKYWRKREQLIRDGRYFMCIKDGRPASYSYITDIDNGGANIAVVTNPAYRKMGLGKAVVSKATEWCLERNILPIYVVDQTNTASINLAESLGYERMTEEIRVTGQA
ncbi:MAG: GNAT family N-acetyltransferase [Candidatus Cloacimonetes bacterium]|nr:GNAT family N-acetyltransferase [Candidatus Cloacimonadota bacterium]